MRTAAIRAKLNEYIANADKEKIRAIYVLLKDEVEATGAWWQDHELLNAFDQEYAAFKAGETTSYSLSDIETTIAGLRAKRQQG